MNSSAHLYWSHRSADSDITQCLDTHPGADFLALCMHPARHCIVTATQHHSTRSTGHIQGMSHLKKRIKLSFSPTSFGGGLPSISRTTLSASWSLPPLPKF